jgi:hypothetical protein
MDFVEYCPISFNEKKQSINYFKGSCKSDSDFGEELGFGNDYHSFSEYFGEQFGNYSFCALSSLIRNNTDYHHKEYVRPTCYSMNCSDKSLTITLHSNNPNYEEYIVCPRKGGMIKVGGI